MQWRSRITMGALFGIAAALATLNVWLAAQRSTIPLRINTRVVDKEMRHEKHPDKDDVYLLRFERGGVLQVDRAVYEAIPGGALVRKAEWDHFLEADGRRVRLNWSRDFRGMVWAMPLLLAVLLTTACIGQVLTAGRTFGRGRKSSANAS